MALFLKQNETRSELQTRIASELQERIKTRSAGTAPDDIGGGMLEEAQEATGRSLFWVSVATMVVIALVVFVLFVFNF